MGVYDCFLQFESFRTKQFFVKLTLGEPRTEDANVNHSHEDPSLTPFENNARNRAGFGGSAFAASAAAGAFASLRKLLDFIAKPYV